MLSHSELKRLLHYDPETGVFTWEIQLSPRGVVGGVAGSPTDGYIIITINRVRYPANRLAWFYHYGVWPTNLIDHKDTDKLNNRIINLREVSNIQNLQNRGLNKNNRSGYKGASWNNKSRKWLSSCCIAGKRYFLGLFETAKEAGDAYKQFAKIHHGEFFNES